MSAKQINSLPKAVRAAFAGKPFLNLRELATAFACSPRTLRRHCDVGNIEFHVRGIGTDNRHRIFTIENAAVFWARTANGQEVKSRRRSRGPCRSAQA